MSCGGAFPSEFAAPPPPTQFAGRNRGKMRSGKARRFSLEIWKSGGIICNICSALFFCICWYFFNFFINCQQRRNAQKIQYITHFEIFPPSHSIYQSSYPFHPRSSFCRTNCWWPESGSDSAPGKWCRHWAARLPACTPCPAVALWIQLLCPHLDFPLSRQQKMPCCFLIHRKTPENEDGWQVVKMCTWGQPFTLHIAIGICRSEIIIYVPWKFVAKCITK